MSSFMGNAGNGTAGIDTSLAADDGRLRGEWFDDDDYRWVTVDDVWALDGWRSPWWPGLGGMDASGNEWLTPIWFDRMEIVSGSIGRFGFLGVTRDVYGTAVGGVTVKLYRTSDDSVVCTTVSDPLGNFGVTTQYYPDTHYMVAYKTGSPDIEGTTANTLVAA
jgi:hypothetical protein